MNIPSLNKKIRPALHPRQLQKELGMSRERMTDQPLSGIIQQWKREYFYSYKTRRQRESEDQKNSNLKNNPFPHFSRIMLLIQNYKKKQPENLKIRHLKAKAN